MKRVLLVLALVLGLVALGTPVATTASAQHQMCGDQPWATCTVYRVLCPIMWGWSHCNPY